MCFGSRGPNEEVVSFSFTTKYNSFFFALQIAHYPKTLSALFPFTQRVRFEFSAACSCSEWNNSFQISKKEDNHARYTQVFDFFFFRWKCSFHSTLLSDFFRIFNWMVHVSEIQQFPEFLETFLYYLPLFPNFRKFCLNGKRPCI